jgi:hypothetical protein
MAMGVAQAVPTEVHHYAHRRFWEELGFPTTEFAPIVEKISPDIDVISLVLKAIRQHCDDEIVQIMEKADA